MIEDLIGDPVELAAGLEDEYDILEELENVETESLLDVLEALEDELKVENLTGKLDELAAAL